MDNRQLDITAEGEADLGLAIRLAWPSASGKATHYKLINLAETVIYSGKPTTSHIITSKEGGEGDGGAPTMILLWHAERGALPLPYPLDLEESIAFLAGWLKKVERGDEPDHDGSNGQGWRAFTESWGHVAGHRYAIVAVQPAWAMYGK